MSGFPQPEYWLEHRVSYGETDAMSMMYYGEYLHLFERGRSGFLRDRGVSYAYIEEQGLYFPVREARCRYLAPARYENLLRLRVGISEWGRASLTFVYEVHHEDRLLTTGMTQHACTNKTGRPVAVPAWLREALSL